MIICYSNPAKSLEIARARLTPEQWAKFEREFDDFCVVQGLEAPPVYNSRSKQMHDWAKWAFFQGRQYAEAESLSAPHCRELILIADDLDTEGEGPLAKSLRRLVKRAARQGELNGRVRDAHFEKIAIAMMSDEQALASLERWKRHTGESK